MASNSTRRPVSRGRIKRAKVLALVAATMPLTQFLVCGPDVLGALSFETQNFINGVIFQWTDTWVRNIFNI